MHVSTTHVLRKFAQKMAAQNKQANPMAGIGAALSDPRVLGGLGGAAAGGLGAYGLARMTQSDEDKENSNTPMMAALLGALAGGAGGVYGGPQLAAMLQGGGKGVAPAAATNSDSLPEIMNGPGGDVDVSQPTRAGITAPKPAPVDNSTAAYFKARTGTATPNAETQDYMAENGIQSSPLSGATGPNVAAYHAMGEEPGVVTGEGGKQVPTPGMAGKPMMGLGSR
jgi:hypothetical protein